MGSQVLVALLVTAVLGDEVEVLAADDDGTVHLGGDDGAGQDTATDGDETGERALLVCSRRVIVSTQSSLGRFLVDFVQPAIHDLCRRVVGFLYHALFKRVPSLKPHKAP